MRLLLMMMHIANVVWSQTFSRYDTSGIALADVNVDLKQCARNCALDTTCTGFSVDRDSECANFSADKIDQAADVILFRKTSNKAGSCPSGTKFFSKFTTKPKEPNQKPNPKENERPSENSNAPEQNGSNTNPNTQNPDQELARSEYSPHTIKHGPTISPSGSSSATNRTNAFTSPTSVGTSSSLSATSVNGEAEGEAHPTTMPVTAGTNSTTGATTYGSMESTKRTAGTRSSGATPIAPDLSQSIAETSVAVAQTTGNPEGTMVSMTEPTTGGATVGTTTEPNSTTATTTSGSTEIAKTTAGPSTTGDLTSVTSTSQWTTVSIPASTKNTSQLTTSQTTTGVPTSTAAASTSTVPTTTGPATTSVLTSASTSTVSSTTTAPATTTVPPNATVPTPATVPTTIPAPTTTSLPSTTTESATSTVPRTTTVTTTTVPATTTKPPTTTTWRRRTIESTTTTVPKTTTVATTTTKPPTTTSTTTTTTTTTRPPRATTLAPCASPASAGVEFKKGTAAQPVRNGDTVEIACKPGQSPTDPSFYLKTSQTLKCSGGKLVNASDPGNASPKVLTCAEGCVKRQYEISETMKDEEKTFCTTQPNKYKKKQPVAVKCASSKVTTSANRKLIGELHSYLCDDNLGSTVKFENGTFSPCTNACISPLPGDIGTSKTLVVTTTPGTFYNVVAQFMYFVSNNVKYQFVFHQEQVDVACATPGETFSHDPSASSLTMICNATTGQFSDSKTGNPLYPTYPLPTCGEKIAPSNCHAIQLSSGYMVAKQNCVDIFDGEQTGCKVFIACTSNPDEVKSSWECGKNKQWKNRKDGSLVATVPAPSC